jgi:hypothetical protein
LILAGRQERLRRPPRTPAVRLPWPTRAALGEEEFVAAWAAGRAMSLEDALALDESRES